MSKRIVVDIKNIDKAINEVKEYEKSIDEKLHLFTQRLAQIGAMEARVSFTKAMYAGKNDVEVEVEELKDGKGYVVRSSGTAVLFIEFGTGILNPEHPQSGEFGYAHGTYGKGKGKNPKGWVYKGEQGNAGKELRPGVYHTYGNPPSRSMYNASKEMRKEITRIAKEVFSK